MRIVTLVLVLFSPIVASAEWQAPPDPDPQAILREAQSDARARRHEDALAKHVWFHEHALEHRSSLSGVRLSFALGYWKELSKAYPPALDKLKELRDAATKRLFEDDDVQNAFRHFADLRAINRVLGEDELTVAAFVRINNEAPKKAKRVYHVAEPELVKAKKFELCGAYLRPPITFLRLAEVYHLNREHAEEQESERFKLMMQDYAENHFLREAGTLVALLSLNDRQAEAEEFAEKARAISQHAERDATLDAALKGEPPEQR